MATERAGYVLYRALVGACVDIKFSFHKISHEKVDKSAFLAHFRIESVASEHISYIYFRHLNITQPRALITYIHFVAESTIHSVAIYSDSLLL